MRDRGGAVAAQCAAPSTRRNAPGHFPAGRGRNLLALGFKATGRQKPVYIMIAGADANTGPLARTVEGAGEAVRAIEAQEFIHGIHFELFHLRARRVSVSPRICAALRAVWRPIAAGPVCANACRSRRALKPALSEPSLRQ